MSYRISLDKAVEYISAFVDMVKPHEKGIPLGGTIHKEGFWGQEKKGMFDTGNMAWFCMSSSLEYPRLFLAFEENVMYSQDREIPEPYSETLQYAKSVFGYQNENIRDLLLNHRIDPKNNLLRGQEISKEKVVEMKRSFTAGISLGEDRFPLNRFPYGFFENTRNQEIVNFTASKEMEYVRYYFGYDDSTDELNRSNRIRVIVVGVNANGKNLVPEMDDPANPPTILQKSWPPPPYTQK